MLCSEDHAADEYLTVQEEFKRKGMGSRRLLEEYAGPV